MLVFASRSVQFPLVRSLGSIMIVEPDQDIAEHIFFLLRDVGIEVAGIVGSAEEAIGLVESKPDLDLVLMAYPLDGATNMLESVQAIRRLLGRAIPVIFIGERRHAANVIFKARHCRYVSTPLQDLDLVAEILKCLQRDMGEPDSNDMW